MKTKGGEVGLLCVSSSLSIEEVPALACLFQAPVDRP